MKRKAAIFLSFAGLLVLFYFFFIRPNIVRRQCSNESLEYSLINVSIGAKGTGEGYRAALMRKELYDKAYESCLHSYGLSK